MKKNNLIVAGFTGLAFAGLLSAKVPVIMTVNGVDVPKTEFEYLYNKNSQQQMSQLPIEEYLEMFKLYKLKVEDAKNEGIDTTASFMKEMAQYKHDLALPYLTDSVYIHKLLHENYERSRSEVEAQHIMLFKTPDARQNVILRQRMDSLHTVLKNGGNFESLAKEYSQDQGSSSRGGVMGYISAMQYPYEFEIAAYETPEGEISEVIESPVGYHILKGGKRRAARGKVKAAHILKLTQGKSDAEQQEVKQEIDSIYQLAVANPSIFGELAKANSEDPGSARQGGELPVFGSGEMVAEFDSVAFALPANTISKPFKTSYGWHIIKKIESVAGPTENEMKPDFIKRINNPQDARFKMVKNNQMNHYVAKHKAKLNDKTIASLNSLVEKNGLDSIFKVSITNANVANLPLFSIDKRITTVSSLVPLTNSIQQTEIGAAKDMLKGAIDNLFYDELLAAEETRLYNEVPDYRNLLNEYVDGSLLYEVSVNKIWDKAAKDTEGLEKYFNENRDNYKWSVPHVKGLLVPYP